MKIIVVCNRKGGCGKSTTAGAMYSYLSKVARKNVLLLDFDSQCNVSYALGADLAGPTLYDVLTGQVTLQDAMQFIPEETKDFSCLVPGSELLSNVDNGEAEIKIDLKAELKALDDVIDYVIIDTAPALALLTGLSLSIADNVVVPVVADIYNIQGMQGVGELVADVNPDATIIGILLTRYRGRLVAVRRLEEMAEEVAARMGVKVFKTKIREGITVVEAAMLQQGLFGYDSDCKSNVAQDYAQFVQEILAEVK